MEPRQPRLDIHAALWRAVSKAVPAERVLTSIDGGATPDEAPLTIIAEPVARAAGDIPVRGVFDVTFSAITYAGTENEARAPHNAIADAILELTELEHGGVAARVARVTCTLEPSVAPSSAAPNWPGIMSSYTAYIRIWR